MQLSRTDWILAATAAFNARGIDGVSIEALARGLGVTKGSYYWHFKDRAELLEALFSAWSECTRHAATASLLATTPFDRLQRFFELLAASGGVPADGGILAWGRRDAALAPKVRSVESRRLEFVRQQLADSGLDGPLAGRRSYVVYFSMLGWLERSPAPEPSAIARFLRLVLEVE
jgi:AcrR family transcriptional regulator